MTSFDLQPTLAGEHVIIRPVAEPDRAGMFAAASDPRVWEQHPVRDRYKEDVFNRFFDEALASGSAFTFLDRATDRIIGSSRYFGLDTTLSEIEIGWTFLARDYWGGKHNRDIKRLMLDHAFRYVDTVVFWVGEHNMRSRRAMEKIGAELRDGTFTRELSGADPYVVYEMSKRAWSDRVET